MELIRNIDELLYDKAFIGLASAGFTGNGAGFGAVKNHELIKEMLSIYNQLSFEDTLDFINTHNNTTIVNKVLYDYGFVPHNKLQLIKGMRVYPSDVFPLDEYDVPLSFTKATHTIHHYEHSWKYRTESLDRNFEKNKKRIFITNIFVTNGGL